MLGAVNVGSSGTISSATIDKKTGNVIIGGEDNGFVSVEGNIDISSPNNSTTPSEI